MSGDSTANEKMPGSAQVTVSQVAGRVLEQLSTSSWLPSGVIVATAVLNYELVSNQGSLESAISDIGQATLPQLLLFIASLTLTTVLAQAFEFEAIRFLEGYWNGAIGSRPWMIGTRYQRRRRRTMTEAIAASKAAVAESVRAVLNAEEPGLGDYFRDRFLCLPIRKRIRRFETRCNKINWAEVADPELVSRYFANSRRPSRWFPTDEAELLPTTLGNVMKRYEELAAEAEGGDGDIEGIVHRTYSNWPEHMRHEYDSFRSRINVYCTLALVFFVAGTAEAGLLAVDGVTKPLAYPAVMLAGSWVAYRASIASAFGLGKALVDGVSTQTIARPTIPVQLSLAV